MRILLPLVALLGLVLLLAGPGQPSVSLLHWWLLNAEPPDITVAGSSSPVRGEAYFSVRLEPPERAEVVRAEVNGLPLEVGNELVVDTTLLQDGRHELVIEAQARSLWRNTGQQSIVFTVDNTPPAIDVRLEPTEPAEGRTLLLRAQLSEPARLSGRAGERELAFHGSDDAWWAVLGVPPAPPYEALDLRLEATDAAGNQGMWEQQVQVAGTDFVTQSIELSPELEPLLAPEVRSGEEARLTPIYDTHSGPPRWSGPFLMPLEGPVTTPFGALRLHSDDSLDNHHAGVDFAAPFGTPVHAPADGQVVFVDSLDLRGNTLILDHGGSVFSLFAHLEEALVGEGDLVRRDEQVALVGSTGLSTGPHLHWELWVAGASVDPLEWTEREFP